MSTGLREFHAHVAAAFRQLDRGDLIPTTPVRVVCDTGDGLWLARHVATPTDDAIEVRLVALDCLDPGSLHEIACHEAAHVAAALDGRTPDYRGHGGPWVRRMRRLGYPSPRARLRLTDRTLAAIMAG